MASEVTTPPAGTTGLSPFKCSYCQRVFSRIDHLHRHVRTHTQEKPYSCRICGKQFGRADLVKRHTSQHVSNALTQKAARIPGRRVIQACRTCAASKLKCSNSKPCQRCLRKNVACDFDSAEDLTQDSSSGHVTDRNNGGRGEASTNNSETDQPTTKPNTQPLSPISEQAQSQPQSQQQSQPQLQSTMMMHNLDQNFDPISFIDIGPEFSLANISMASIEPSRNQDDRMNSYSDARLEPYHNNAAQSYSEVLRDILGSTEATPMLMEGTDENSSNTWDLFLNTDHEFADLGDLSFVDLQVFSMEYAGVAMPEAGSNHRTSSFEQMASTAATQAFKVSGWDWAPTPHDSTSVETTKFILPPGCASSENSGSSVQVQLPAILGSEDRNRLLSLLLYHCDKEKWIRIAPTFPSELFLDQMLYQFFASQRADSLPWFHIPSFRPDRIRDELLSAIIGIGACFTPNEAVQGFGYTMPEILRYAIVERLTKDNAKSRDIQFLHSWLTQAALSIWSGNKRQMEIGEGNYQLVITIIRRARWLRRDHYKVIRSKSYEKGEDLHRTWQHWVQQESKKRLIYRAFQFDTQMSMINHVNPLMSYAEMHVPFPESNSMWWAATAEEWRTECLRCTHRISDDPLTLADTVRITMSEGYWSQTDFDLTSSIYTLYGFWSLVWEYQQLQETMSWGGLTPGDTAYDAPSLMLPARRELLMKGLNILRGKLASLKGNDAMVFMEPLLVLEYLSMVLLVPIQGLQAFAGRDGEREARRIFPVLQEWIQTREARQSIWHAGQVYKAAKAHASKSLRDLRVMLIYQASITFWVYGVIVRARRSCDGSFLPAVRDINRDTLVWLDGENNVAVRKFIAMAEGIPALQDIQRGSIGLSIPSDDESTCLAEDASATMSIGINILKRPLSPADGAQLAIVESITRLMLEIAKVAKKLSV